MKILFYILLIIANTHIFADRLSFERKLNQFKYSLYSDFNQLKRAGSNVKLEQYLANPENPEFHVIEEKIKIFLKNNDKEIITYRIESLKKYQHNKINNTSLTEDTDLVKRTIRNIPDSFWLKLTKMNWMRLAHLNPVEQSIKIVSLIIEKEQKMEDFVNLKVVETLARPMIKTKMLDKENWEVIIDKFNHVYTCRVNIKNGNIKVVNIQKR